MPISLSGSLLITGSLTTSGTLTAQTLVVQTVTSSIVYSSGSNIFGNSLTNTQQMTGSLRVTGSGNHYILGGNVGIGTSSPVDLLTLNATSSSTVFTLQNGAVTKALLGISYDTSDLINNSAAGDLNIRTNNTNLNFSTNNGSTLGMRIGTSGDADIRVGGNFSYHAGANRGTININGATSAMLSFSTAATTNKGYIYHNGTYMEVWNVDNSYLDLGTNNISRLKITNQGQSQFKHGQNDLDVITVQNTSSSPYGMNITYTAASPNNGSNNFLYLADSTGLRFAARSNGGLSNYSGNNVNLASDIRLKKDIVSLSSEWDKLKQIEVVNFRYKDSNEETTLYGAIAQQVQEIYPNLVIVTREATETEPEYYGLREQPFQWLTTKVLQEAMTKIEEQQIQIQNLHSQIESQNTLIQELTTRLTALENK